MSYSCTISFTKISGDNVFDFFKKLKTKIKENLNQIAEENYFWLPTIRYGSYKNLSQEIQNSLDEKWVQEYILKFRYFFMPENDILGIFSLPKCTYDMFDNTTYFQNSTDQDYEYSEWNGIEDFEKIAQKWQSCSKEDILKENPDCNNEEDFEYVRKTHTYEEIWEIIKQYLYDENEVVYISLFGGYEGDIISELVHKMRTLYSEWQKQFSKKENVNEE